MRARARETARARAVTKACATHLAEVTRIVNQALRGDLNFSRHVYVYVHMYIYMCDATGTSLAHTRASLEYILEEKRDASSFARRECAFLGLLYLGVRIFSLCMIFF